jgi:putative restriction endonuclease
VLQKEPVCRVTGVANPSLLIASHIKPWAHCNTNAERLDENNGLMLTPTVDHLFDKGFISFSDDGHLILSRLFSDGDVSRLNLDIEIAAVAFSAEQVDFLTYHRNRIFKA